MLPMCFFKFEERRLEISIPSSALPCLAWPSVPHRNTHRFPSARSPTSRVVSLGVLSDAGRAEFHPFTFSMPRVRFQSARRQRRALVSVSQRMDDCSLTMCALFVSMPHIFESCRRRAKCRDVSKNFSKRTEKAHSLSFAGCKRVRGMKTDAGCNPFTRRNRDFMPEQHCTLFLVPIRGRLLFSVLNFTFFAQRLRMFHLRWFIHITG